MLQRNLTMSHMAVVLGVDLKPSILLDSFDKLT